MNATVEHWYDGQEGDVHSLVWDFVTRIEKEQADTFDRIARLESAYDPHSPSGDEDTSSRLRRARAYENMIASAIDTVYAAVATSDVRARFMTDDAEWSVQRRAKKLEYYAEGLAKKIGIHKLCRLAFKESAKKGAGLVKVYDDRWEEIRAEHVPLADIVVPDADARSGAPPLQLHHVQRNYDRDRLIAEYPKYKAEIRQAFARRSSLIPRFVPFLAGNKLTVIESWRLPIGKRPANGMKRSAKGARYVPGRHTVVIDGATLLDEEYHKPHYPFAMIGWSERLGSFYPISGAERIAPVQDSLNRFNTQVDASLERNAFPTTFVKREDFGSVAPKSTGIGRIVAIKKDMPTTQAPPVVHPEIYNERIRLRESAFEQLGVSRLAAQSKIPAGLETGAAVREYRDQTTQRFAPQEADFEQLVLDAVLLMIEACKDLGSAAPMVLESRWKKPIAWSQVDMGQVAIQIEAASTLPRTPAGREQTLLEWAQAGIISTDSARELSGHPDLERELSLYTGVLDSIDQRIEDILDGGYAVPEPYDNLKMVQWRATGRYHNAHVAGAPEEVLENLRDFIAQAAWIDAQQSANDNATQPAQGDVNAPPGGAPPQAALSSQAMDLRPTG